MEEGIILQELEELAGQLAVEVRYDDLEGGRGGLCRFGGKTLLVVDRQLNMAERIALFRRALGQLSLDEVFIRPRIRELLQSAESDPFA